VAQNKIDALLVGLFLPLGINADYSIAGILAEQLRKLWNILQTVRYPTWVRMPRQARRSRLVLEGGLIWCGFAASALLLALACHWLIPILLPPAYRTSLGYLDILLGTLVASVPAWLAETYFRSEQDERRQYVLRVWGAGLSLVMPLAFIWTWQAYGVALGRLLAAFFMSGIAVVLFLRSSPQPADSALSEGFISK
jgi:O-antigen/teichoic acid export membrane protein